MVWSDYLPKKSLLGGTAGYMVVAGRPNLVNEAKGKKKILGSPGEIEK